MIVVVGKVLGRVVLVVSFKGDVPVQLSFNGSLIHPCDCKLDRLLSFQLVFLRAADAGTNLQMSEALR